MAFRNTYRFSGAFRSLAWLLLLAWSAKSASASFIPIFESAENGTYNYRLGFSSNGRVESLAGGDNITLYDVAVPGTVLDVTLPFNRDFEYFSATLQPIGHTEPSLVGAAGLDDDPLLLNLTIRYHGRTQYDTTIPGFSITIAGATDETRLGLFSSTNHLVLPSYNIDQLGFMFLPVLVPEPGMMGLAGVLVGMNCRRARRG